MDKKIIRAFLEALAYGDAYGKATEYCTREEIENSYDNIDRLLGPDKAIAHNDLFYGQVTDDTEQNVYLIKTYAAQKRVTPYETAMTLLQWVNETDAEQKYIGPNTLKALRDIERGADVTKAGLGGTTCGGMMRTPAAFLFSNERNLEENVVNCLMPTHNTAVAMEAAMCYAYALRAADQEKALSDIFAAAVNGALLGRTYGSKKRMAAVAPSCAERLKYLQKIVPLMTDEKELKAFLYNILGTTLASADVCAAVFAIFLYAKKDVQLAVRLSTELGGDTDTIACLAAALCTLYAKGHNLNLTEVALVETANGLNFEALADMIVSARKEWSKT